MHDTRTNTFIPDTMHYPFKKDKKNICSLNVLPINCLLKILQMTCLRTEESSYLQNLFLFITLFQIFMLTLTMILVLYLFTVYNFYLIEMLH